ncbi:Pol I core factor CF [Haplosporangium sp. Z 27]|nr:Pol I core factor CF [Haplosporangium sp. Z 27]
MQLILRRQIYALIHDLGFPSEFEQVAREYWILYLSGLRRLKDKDSSKPDHDTVIEGNIGDDSLDSDDSSENMPEDGDSEATPRKQQVQNRFRDKTVDKASNLDTLDDEYLSNSSYSSSDEDVEEENNEESESESDKGIEEELSPVKKRQWIRSHYDSSGSINIRFTIAVCYLAAQHLKLPVIYGDFYRWTVERKIPYYNALGELPADMKRWIDHNRQGQFLPGHKFMGTFQMAVQKLLNSFSKTVGKITDIPNLPPLVFRFTQELMLPIEVYPCALRLLRAYVDTINAPHKKFYGVLKRDVQRPTTIPVYAMATVIIVAKLLFGLDGKKSEMEELIQVNPDLYSEHCEKELWPAFNAEFDQLIRIFQTTDYAQRMDDQNGNDRISPSIEAFIKKLYSNIPPPDEPAEESSSKPPPLRPGEGFVHYKTDNVEVYLGQYERLLGYASNILCVDSGYLEGEVSYVENALFSHDSVLTVFGNIV